LSKLLGESVMGIVFGDCVFLSDGGRIARILDFVVLEAKSSNV